MAPKWKDHENIDSHNPSIKNPMRVIWQGKGNNFITSFMNAQAFKKKKNLHRKERKRQLHV